MGKPPAYRVGKAMEKVYGTNTKVQLEILHERINVNLNMEELWMVVSEMDRVNEYDELDHNGQPYKMYELLDGWEDEITMPDEEEAVAYRETPDQQSTFSEFTA